MKYIRKLEIRRLEVPPEEVARLHDFYQQVNRDECRMVLLRVLNEDSDADSVTVTDALQPLAFESLSSEKWVSTTLSSLFSKGIE